MSPPFHLIVDFVGNVGVTLSGHINTNNYLFDYVDEVTAAVKKVFGLNIGRKTMTLGEIKKILQMRKKDNIYYIFKQNIRPCVPIFIGIQGNFYKICFRLKGLVHYFSVQINNNSLHDFALPQDYQTLLSSIEIIRVFQMKEYLD